MKSKSKPKQSSPLKPMPTEQQFQAMCRRLEASLLQQGATAPEVALLRQHSGDALTSALTIALMLARLEEKGLSPAP